MASGAKTGLGLLLAVAIGFLLGRATADVTGPRVATPEAMAEALRLAFVEPDPMLRARDMNRLIPRIDAENLPGAIETFRAFSTRAETLGVSEFFAIWSRLDVEGLAAAMETWPDQKAKSQGIGWVAYQYAKDGGTARAVPYYEALTPPLRLVTGYRVVEGALNQGDEEGLVRWIGAQDDAAERSRLTQAVVLKLMRERGADSAIAFFDRVPAESAYHFKRQVFLVTLDKLVRSDPEKAVAFLDARAAEPWAEKGLAQLVAAWTDVDPPAALAFLEGRRAEPDFDEALETLVDRWSAHDQRAAIDWTRQQLPSPLVDRLCRRFTAALTVSDPDQAMELAGRIVDPAIRHDALRGFARYWFLRKPEETRRWLVAGGLAESEADALVGELTKTREHRLGRKAAAAGQG